VRQHFLSILCPSLGDRCLAEDADEALGGMKRKSQKPIPCIPDHLR